VPDHAFPGAVTAAFNWNPSWGHIGVRALYQQWSGWGYNDATNTQDDWNEGAFAWQVGCNIPVFGKDTIIASVYGGEGMGAYGMGMTGRASIEPGSGYGDAYLMEEMGFALGYTHVWNDTWRSNLIVSQVSRDEDEDEGVAGPAVIENYQQVILNTYWNVTPTMELGMEYSYGIVNFFEDTPNPYQPGSTDENPTQHAIYLSLTTQFF
jgi:hypothetical protein